MRAALGARVHARAIAAGCLVAIAGLAVAGPARASACPHATGTPGSATPAQFASATICLVNGERNAAGRRPLASDSSLGRVARTYAREMVAAGEFAHRNARSGNVANRVFAAQGSLARWIELGENLGWGSFEQASPQAMVDGWMASPTHRDNVLYSRFNRIGLGVTAGSPASSGQAGTVTYVAVFGRAREKRTRARRCTAKQRARGARTCRARR